jgi:hypothetical protein
VNGDIAPDIAHLALGTRSQLIFSHELRVLLSVLAGRP